MDSSLDALVTQARAALAGKLPDSTQATAGPYLGSAADGLITAEVSIEGRVRSLSIDPSVLRRPLADVTAEIRTAINGALAARPGKADFAPVADALRAVREQAGTELTAIVQAMAEVEQHVRAAREERAANSAGQPGEIGSTRR
jgi:DNA-binding protein YbaB